MINRFSRLRIRHGIALRAFIISGFMLVCVCYAGAASDEGKEYRGRALLIRIFFKPLPKEMPGSRDDTPEMIRLGHRLFFERNISLTKSQSCNDCHHIDFGQAGVDHRPTSRGAKGISGARNAPTVLNAGFQTSLFWDGRAHDLEEQAKGPLLNVIEMAMRNEDDVLNQLRGTKDYLAAFQQAFPGQADPVTFDNVARAIAAFERTLITPSRFDRYLEGDLKALTESEQKGFARFVDTGCVTCHGTHAVGGRIMRKLGVYHPYENQSDTGRQKITGLETDRFVFKVCMLRNVTLTAPYFHDGRISTLPEAVRLMAYLQLNKKLGPGHVDEIVRFLYALEAEHPLIISQP
jgi:cytochrome c peroxidase